MRTASPWWLSAALAAGLVFLFLGERAFADTAIFRQLCTGGGLLLIFGSTALRLLYFLQSGSKRKVVERTLLLCHAGVMLGLVGYALTTGWGRDMLGLKHMSDKGAVHYQTAMTVIYAIILLVSMVPMLMTELGLGLAERSMFQLPWHVSKKADDAEAAVDADRVNHMATSGLTIALATALLMVTCNVADQRNVRKDVSYFKTSSPGTAVQNMVSSISTKLKVILMFPDVNEVKEEVKGYFQTLADETGRVEIEEHNPLTSPLLAEKYRARMSQNTKDTKGYVVLIHEKAPPPDKPDAKPDQKSSTFSISTDMKRARRRDLRRFDATVHKHLFQVLTEKRVACFSVGHGEANALPAYLRRRSVVTSLRKTLQNMRYTVRDWSGTDTPDVPANCSVLFILAPQSEISEGELEAVDRYLASGGSTLIAMDPAIVSVFGFRGARGSSANLGPVEGRLGIKYDPTPIMDRPMGIMRLGQYRLQVMGTREFSSHASVTGMSRVKGGMPLLVAGSWHDVPFTDKRGKSKRYYVIKSERTSWLDKKLNGRFDKDEEKRGRYNVAVAIEGPVLKDEANDAAKDKKKLHKRKRKKRMRAMVFGDIDILADLLHHQSPVFVEQLLRDAVNWLGGQETFSGTLESEEDVPIKHTKKEDVIWFYSTIVGAPFFVLGFGFLTVFARRRRSRRSTRSRS